jgi:hypothetical protein
MSLPPADYAEWPMERRNAWWSDQNRSIHGDTSQTGISPAFKLSLPPARADGRAAAQAAENWPEPKPLPDGLLPVAPFDYAFLPDTIAPWVADISERMQCPPDFVGVAAMVALGSVLGRKVAVRPQRKTDWIEACLSA